MPGFCGAQLPDRQLSHAYPGDDVLFWGILSGSFLAPYLLCLYWKGDQQGRRLGRHAGRLPDCSLPAAFSGFTTPDGPLYACIAMAVSFLLCFAVSKLATIMKWRSSQRNDAFYRIREEAVPDIGSPFRLLSETKRIPGSAAFQPPSGEFYSAAGRS